MKSCLTNEKTILTQELNNMQLNDSKKFIEMLQHTRKTVEMLLKIDKNPPNDVKIFLEVLDELQSAAELITNDKEWVKFFFDYSEDIGVVLAFVKNLPSKNK